MSELFIDIENDGDPWTGRLLCVGYSWQGVTFCDVGEVSSGLQSLLADPRIPVVEHSKHDARWLRLAGYEVAGPIIDTMTMAWNLDESQPLDLESLAQRFCGITMDKRISRNKTIVRFQQDDKKYVPIGEAPLDQLVAYNRRDVQATVALYKTLYEVLANNPILFDQWQKIDVPFTSVLLDMECAGMPVDVVKARGLRDDLRLQRDALEVELRRQAGLPANFNFNSPDQVAAHLFLDKFELPDRIRVGEPVPEGFTITKTGRLWQTGTWRVKGRRFQAQRWTKGRKDGTGSRPICDAATLAIHFGADPWVQDYLKYKELDKLVGTYLENFVSQAHKGRLYCKFNQTNTVTGRLSSSELNLQNIPSRGEWGDRIRGLFKGDFIIGDFSQLEPRLMAHFSQDPGLLRIFHEGLDVYRVLGQSIFRTPYDDVTPEQRDQCKELLLAMGYGAMAKKIAERLSIRGYHTTPSEAQAHLDALLMAYPVFWEWKEETVTDAEEYGVVYTIAGRARHLEDAMESEDWNTKTHGDRQAVNSRIQGSAADIVKATMLESKRVFPDLPLLVQVHDELIYEVPKGADAEVPMILEGLQRIGENPPWELSVPLEFRPKRVSSWNEK